MGKKYRHYDQQQTLLLPPNLNDWLPQNHLARFVSNMINDLDNSQIINYYEEETRGAPPYDPFMMIKVRIYADCRGITSSRVIERSMVDDLGFRFLGAGNFPNHRTISDFRKIHNKPLALLFEQVLSLCEQAGLVDLDIVALDGVKVKANASIDKNRTLEKLTELKKKYIKEIVRHTIEEGIKVDEEEDRIYGPDNNGWSLPDDALERVRRAKRELEEIERKEKEDHNKHIEERKRKEEETGKRLRGRKPLSPEEKKQNGKVKEPVVNITDLDSRIMKTRKGYIQGYNAQIVVDTKSQVIIASELVQDQNDINQFEPMMNQAIKNTKRIPKNMTADAGYDNTDQINPFNDLCRVLVPTQKDWKQRKAIREQPPPRGRIPKRLTERERRERRLLTKKGRSTYKKRGSSVEPVIGQITSGRGLVRLWLRGVKKAKYEWKMHCMTHNILKLWRHTIKASI